MVSSESTLKQTHKKKPNHEELQTYDILKFTVQKPISQFTILIHVNFRIPNSGFMFFTAQPKFNFNSCLGIRLVLSGQVHRERNITGQVFN